mmetsp:Transcript_56834/g.132470  ORF Transcript_56834/g.132470 Transcript_56834/m.132470 type:complete len:674 (-) Transcript_56834:571-2592(-)
MAEAGKVLPIRGEHDLADAEKSPQHAIVALSPKQAPSSHSRDQYPAPPRLLNRKQQEANIPVCERWNCENGDATMWHEAAFARGESALTFQDVACSVKTEKGEEQVILEPVSGHFEPGSLVAVMGPSGSGKSTLLDILAGKKTMPSKGHVRLNGRPLDTFFRRMVAYVPQEDILPAHLTVKEAVLFHSSLREEMPSAFSREMASQLIDRRLEALGLGSVKDSMIGDDRMRGISGGQKRRLSLARGLSSGPHIVFCDEPTSGLSATDAEVCVRYMHSVVERFHITMVVVIHQPRIEVAKLFSHLLLLTASPGRVVYSGPMGDAVTHLARVGFPVPENINPLDYCLDLITPARGSCEEAFVNYYTVHCKPLNDNIVREELHNERYAPVELLEKRRRILLQFGRLPPLQHSRYGTSFAKQLRLVIARQLTLSIRDKQRLIADLVVALAKAAVVGTAYMDVGSLHAQHQCGFFFMVLMSCSIDGMKHMPRIIEDRTIMKMETSDALYSEWAYIVAFTAVTTSQTLVSHFLFVVPLFMISGLTWDLFKCLCLWTTLLALTMDSLYLMVAAMARDSSSAQILSLPFLMFLLLYNGFLAAKTTVPRFMEWAIKVSPVSYAMEEIVIAAADVYGGDEYAYTLKLFGYKDEFINASTVMCTYLVLFRTAQVVCLKRLNNLKR